MNESQSNSTICSMIIRDNHIGIGMFQQLTGNLLIYEHQSLEKEFVIDHLINKYQFDILILPNNIHNKYSDYLERVKKENNEDFQIVYRDPKTFIGEERFNIFKKIKFTAPEDEQEDLMKLIYEGIFNLSSKVLTGVVESIIRYLEENIEEKESIVIHSIRSLELFDGLYVSRGLMEEIQIISEELHPSIHNNKNKKEGLSLFSLLNRCTTHMGKQKLRSWFFMTNNKREVIEERLDIIELFIQPKMHPLVNELISYLNKIPDIQHMLIYLQKGICKCWHWNKIYQGFDKISKLCVYIAHHPVFYNFVQFQIFNLENGKCFDLLKNEIEQTLVLENKNKIAEPEVIDQDVAEKKKIYINLDDLLKQVENDMIEKLPPENYLPSLSIIFIPQHGFLIKISKVENKNAIPDDFVFEFETDYFCYFKNILIKELDQKYGKIYNDIINQENKIIFQLSNKLLSHSKLISDMWNATGVLDAIISLSIVAVESKYVRPHFSDKREIKIINGRHPILERITDRYIPNSIEMYEDESHIHLISGPNCSGKSVYLKQIELIIFMAYLGSFVPADEALIPELNYLHGIFHLQNNPSKPFTSEFLEDILKINEFLSKSEQKSILLIDEFCKNSAVEDGSSLLFGFIKYLHSMKEKCPFAFISTHYHQILHENIISLNYFVPCSMNIKIQDNEDEILFLYELKKGLNFKILSSFGIQCAMKANLDNKIIERAKYISNCINSFQPIKPNPECFNIEEELKTQQSIDLLLKWDGKGNPRELLISIEKIMNS